MKEFPHTSPDLHSLLSKFHVVSERQLKAVSRVYTDNCLEKVVLDFDGPILVVTANPDDDTVTLDITNHSDADKKGWIDANRSEVWKSFIEKPLGWGWVTVNQQGYVDGILLSFGGLTPQVILNVIASSIEEKIIQ